MEASDHTRQSSESAFTLDRDDLSAILDLCHEPVVLYDEQFQFLYANAAAVQQMDRPSAYLIGKVLWHEFPEASVPFRDPLTRAMQERIPLTFEIRDDQRGTIVEGRCSPVFLSGPKGQFALAVFFRNITKERRSQEDLQSSEERLRLAVEGAEIGTWHWDILTNCLYWSDTTSALLGLPGTPIPTYDMFMQVIHPEDRSATHEAVLAAIENKCAYDVEYRAVWQDGSIHWHISRGRCYYDDQGVAVRMEGILIDITDRKRVEEQLRFRAERDALLHKIERALRVSADPNEIQLIAVRELAETLHVDRCYFAQYDLSTDTNWIGKDFHVKGLPSLAGEYRISQFQVNPEDFYSEGQTLVIDDLSTWSFPEPLLNALRELRLRSGIAVPFHAEGRLVATLSVAMADEPRNWTPDDIALVESVASQTRSAVEAARLLAEQQAQILRDGLINRIGAAIRSSSHPEEIQATAVDIVGSTLRVDRCFLAVYDAQRDIAWIGEDWHRDHLVSVSGQNRLSDYVPMLNELFGDGLTAVVEDITIDELSDITRQQLLDFQVRSLMAVPFYENGRLASALIVGMSDEARRWTDDEVSLLEIAAVQMRTAIETARLQEREHRIAIELQNALQPPAPESIPGLSLATVAKPALDEAAIGGDFYDVFPLDKELYAIIVGDVSGKGLAAAAQLATVRNMLRAFLYQYRGVGEAASNLNKVLADHDLLTGFVTALVCLCDVSNGEIAYVSCGHEPALIRRGSSPDVEALLTSGPPLGVHESSEYQEHKAQLDYNDTLLIYTDGISEAGPDRRDLFGTDGVIERFGIVDASARVNEIASEIVKAASEHANGALHDDVCVLVARREMSR